MSIDIRDDHEVRRPADFVDFRESLDRATELSERQPPHPVLKVYLQKLRDSAHLVLSSEATPDDRRRWEMLGAHNDIPSLETLKTGREVVLPFRSKEAA